MCTNISCIMRVCKFLIVCMRSLIILVEILIELVIIIEWIILTCIVEIEIVVHDSSRDVCVYNDYTWSRTRCLVFVLISRRDFHNVIVVYMFSSSLCDNLVTFLRLCTWQLAFLMLRSLNSQLSETLKSNLIDLRIHTDSIQITKRYKKHFYI